MNLTGTNWKIKDAPSLSAIGSKNVNFTSNDEAFLSLTIAADGLTYGSTKVYGELGAVATVSNLGAQDPSTVVFARDADFPTSFEEWTDANNNVFIKIPTMYRKINTVEDGQITSFTISTGKKGSAYEPYSVFKYGNTVLPYVYIGKYLFHSSSIAASVQSGSPYSQGLNNARVHAQNVGTGYQLYDWQFHKLFQDLAIVVNQQIDEGGVSTLLGINELTGGEMWLDGIAQKAIAGSDVCKYLVCYDPSKYVSSPIGNESSDYVQVSYDAANANPACISKLGYDIDNPFVNFANAFSGSIYNHFYCSGTYNNAGNDRPVTIVMSGSGTAGLFMQATTNLFSGSYKARLCYRPIS